MKVPGINCSPRKGVTPHDTKKPANNAGFLSLG